MISATPQQERLLRDLIKAGEEGLPFKAVRYHRDYGMGDALGLVVDGLIRADEHEERLWITEKGSAYALRVAS